MGLIGFIFEIGVLGCLIGGIASNAAVVGKERRRLSHRKLLLSTSGCNVVVQLTILLSSYCLHT